MTPFQQQIETFRREWESDAPTLTLQTSGSTGTPKRISVKKNYMAASARRTCKALDVQAGNTSLLCMPVDYIAGRMVCVRAWECGLQLLAVEPSLHPLAALVEAPYFAAMTPAQVFETLLVPQEASLLRDTRVLLIGGGAVSESVAKALGDMPGAWSTYGMTETLSHIALRHISETAYKPLPEVSLALDGRGCLVVTDPVTGVSELATNDLAELTADGRFRILGRADNTICSGGLKWQIEDLESRLETLPVPYQITAVPDERLGEAVALLYAGEALQDELEGLCKKLLPKHALPRRYLHVPDLPLTRTGKPDRKAARQLFCDNTGNGIPNH